MARLNTNTRYLHDALVDYARRLAATLPDPLQVVLPRQLRHARPTTSRCASPARTPAAATCSCSTTPTTATSLADRHLSPYKFDRPGGTGRPARARLQRCPYRGADGDAARYADACCGGVAPGARFFAESLPGCGGQIVLPRRLPRRPRSPHARAAGGVCIADEVQVGFGRVGAHFWGFETQGVVPDIVTIGKPIGNGHPLGAVVTTPEIAARSRTGMEYFNTFGGNPVSAAIGLAVLDVIARRAPAGARRPRSASSCMAGLRELDGRHPLIGDVRGARPVHRRRAGADPAASRPPPRPRLSRRR